MHNIVLSRLAQTLHFNNSITRGHDFKLFINRCNKIVFSAYFTNRVATVWNDLPYDCFTVNSLTCFKRRFYNTDFSYLLKRTLLYECFIYFRPMTSLVAFPTVILYLIAWCYVLYVVLMCTNKFLYYYYYYYYYFINSIYAKKQTFRPTTFCLKRLGPIVKNFK